MIGRILEAAIRRRMQDKKAIILMGARQVGKTTMLQHIFGAEKENVLWLSGDNQDVRLLFENFSAERMKSIATGKQYIVIDEAQRIQNVGVNLKIIIDQIPSVQLFATGSSSFDLANKINEPLTGRKWEYRLYPLSFEELVSHTNLLEEKRMLPHRLVFGAYPDVVSNPGDEIEILRGLTDSYLYKDILEFDKIHKPDKLMRLLQALAYQVGAEVSFNELAQLCGLDSKTVDAYISILEQAYIVFRLGSYSRNLRNELKSSRKIYFYDNGVRNAVIGNFSQIEGRMDAGALFENYVISERIKRNAYTGNYALSWFWRTTAKQEVDYLEEKDGKLTAVELKWNPRRKAAPPLSFRRAYPDAEFIVVNRDNIEDLLLYDIQTF